MSNNLNKTNQKLYKGIPLKFLTIFDIVISISGIIIATISYFCLYKLNSVFISYLKNSLYPATFGILFIYHSIKHVKFRKIELINFVICIITFFIGIGLLLLILYTYYYRIHLKQFEAGSMNVLILKPGRDFDNPSYFPWNGILVEKYNKNPVDFPFMTSNMITANLKEKIIQKDKTCGITFDLIDDTKYIDLSNYSKLEITFKCMDSSIIWPYFVRLTHNPYRKSHNNREKYYADSKIEYFPTT